jgi:hypothetical protein
MGHPEFEGPQPDDARDWLLVATLTGIVASRVVEEQKQVLRSPPPN